MTDQMWMFISVILWEIVLLLIFLNSKGCKVNSYSRIKVDQNTATETLQLFSPVDDLDEDKQKANQDQY